MAKFNSMSLKGFKKNQEGKEIVKHGNKTPWITRGAHHILAGFGDVENMGAEDFIETMHVQYAGERTEGNIDYKITFAEYLDAASKQLERRIPQLQWERDHTRIVTKDEAEAMFELIKLLQSWIAVYLKINADRPYVGNPKSGLVQTGSGLIVPASAL